jgi:AcrR family transcriptional regulator
MAKTARTRTPSAGMEAALLEAATKLLDEEGPEALSVRRIAAAAGVAPMGVYNHFESKFGIVDALFIQGFARLSEALDAAGQVNDPYEALRECGRRYRALALAHPMVYQVMFLRAVPGFEPSERAVECAGDAFSKLTAAVERAMAAGVIIEGPPFETARLIWASIHGWMALELMGIGDPTDQEAGFDRVCSTMLDGLSPETVRRSAATRSAAR